MVVENLIITQFVNYINSVWRDIPLPCCVTIGSPFLVTGESLYIQILGKAQLVRKYIRGKYSGTLPFALYYRLSKTEIDGIEAKLLIPSENLEMFLIERTFDWNGYNIKRIEQTKGGTPFSKSEDGTIVYQSLWEIEFEVK